MGPVQPERGKTRKRLLTDAVALLLVENPQRSGADKFITMRAYGGRLSFKGVKVRSLDRSANSGKGGPDTNVDDGRRCVRTSTVL